MISRFIILTVCMLLGYSESAFVDTLSKCAHEDNDCLKHFFQKIIVEYSSTGIPEYEILPFDPYKVKVVVIPILGLLNITLEDAEVNGIKNCIIENIGSEIAKGFTKIELTCDIVLKGKFLVGGTNPIADPLFEGKSIHGNGNVEIKAEKLHVDMKILYDLVKKENDNIYISPNLKDSEFSYDIGNFHAQANNIFMEKEDVSEQLLSYINNNWKLLIKLFGKDIMDVILVHVHGIINSIFASVPLSKIISDDLTSYVKN